MGIETPDSGTHAQRFSEEQQRSFVLARLRSYGPAFDDELIAECFTRDPGARVAELNAQGHHIETMRAYRLRCGGRHGWSALYVMRVKDAVTGTVLAAPVPVGHGPVLERWAP